MNEDQALHTAERLRAAIRSRVPEIEQQRRLPRDLAEDLERAGCFRLMAPKWSTGTRPDYRGTLRLIEALAEADGSVGWTLSQVALGQVILGYLPRPTLEEVYSEGPDVRVAGVFAPKGRASRTDLGWRVKGQWSFATGCQLASWIYVQCLVVENRRVVLTPDQTPLTRLALFRARDVEVIENWETLGLNGTGSHDVRIEDRICPEPRTCSLADIDGTGDDLQAVPLLEHAGLFLAAVATGIAAGALDEVVQIAATGKRPTFSPQRLADDPVFRERLGEAHMQWRATRALLYFQADLVESRRVGEELSAADRASLVATCHHVTTRAATVVDTAFQLARSASISTSSPLQQRLRDIHTATQHAWSSWDSLHKLGASLLAGEDGKSTDRAKAEPGAERRDLHPTEREVEV